MELTPTLILNLALLIVPPVVLVLVFRQWLARHIRWTVALTALCDVFLFWDELFYYESFGLFAVLILVLDWIPLILISFSVNICVISTSSPGLS